MSVGSMSNAVKLDQSLTYFDADVRESILSSKTDEEHTEVEQVAVSVCA